MQEQQEKERVARAISHAEKLARAEQLRDKKIAEVKRKVMLMKCQCKRFNFFKFDFLYICFLDFQHKQISMLLRG